MRYAKYKPTNIPWIPEIPEGWEVRSVKSIAKISNGSDPKTEGDVPVYGSGGKSFKTCGEYKEGPVVLLGRKGSIEIPHYIVGRYWNVDTAFDVRVNACANLRWFYYLAMCFDYHSYLSRTVLPSMTQTSYYGMRIPFPSLSEQEQIAHFLDEKCGKIDRWVAAKEREVALLKELKQAMIAEAVTGATNVSRTDTARKMKPSGIPWLPEVPEGWEVKKVRQLARESKTKNKGNVEKNVLSLSYGHIIRKKEVYSGLVPTDFATYQIVEKDYVVLRLTDLQNDHKSLRCGLVCERGIITSAYVSLVPQNVLPAYLYLALHTCDLNKVFYSMGGGLRQSMNFADVGNLFVPVPPLAEQRAIVAYIEARAAKIDAAVAGLEREVAAMKEYKQRLIAEVVTGQRRVV